MSAAVTILLEVNIPTHELIKGEWFFLMKGETIWIGPPESQTSSDDSFFGWAAERALAWVGEEIFVPTVELFTGRSNTNAPTSEKSRLYAAQSYREQARNVAFSVAGGKLLGQAAGWFTKKIGGFWRARGGAANFRRRFAS